MKTLKMRVRKALSFMLTAAIVIGMFPMSIGAQVISSGEDVMTVDEVVTTEEDIIFEADEAENVSVSREDAPDDEIIEVSDEDIISEDNIVKVPDGNIISEDNIVVVSDENIISEDKISDTREIHPVYATGSGSNVAEVIDGDNTTGYSDFNAAVEAWNNAGEGAILKLLENIETRSTISVTGGNLKLDLNDHGIMYTGDAKASVITISNGNALEINDSCLNDKTVRYITITNYRGNYRGTEVSAEPGEDRIKVRGGYITGGYASTGAGVNNDGTFTLNGGVICGNIAVNEGGGIYNGIYKNFIMNGGCIYKNFAAHGGGICNHGEFTFNEGRISGNTANSIGGGIYNVNNITMNGGEISGNIVNDPTQPNGFGVYNLDSGTVAFGKNGYVYMGRDESHRAKQTVEYAMEYLHSDQYIKCIYEACIIKKTGEIVYDNSFLSAVAKWKNAGDGATLKLLDNVNSAVIDLNCSGQRILDLNGYGIMMQQNCCFQIQNSSFIFTDNCGIETTRYITLTDGRGSAFDVSKPASGKEGEDYMEVNGGYITGGASLFNIFSGCSVTMNGGNICGNRSISDGAGIWSSGPFIMNGGEIYGNSADGFGGGIYNARKVTMNGGRIYGNTAAKGGNAIYNLPGRTVEFGGDVYAGAATDGSDAVKLDAVPEINDINSYGYIEVKPGTAPVHNFTYTVRGATITAKCSDPECDLPGKTASITINAPVDLVYDGTAKKATISGDTSVLDAPEIKYMQGTRELDAAPVNSGTYNASMSLGGATAKVTYTIDKKPVTITGLGVNDKKYDGNTNAAVKGEALIDGLVNSDIGKVSVNGGTAAFSDANAGKDKTVTFSGYSLTGEAAGNYSLSGQPASVKAEIKKADAKAIEDVIINLPYTSKGISASAAGKMPSDAGTLTYKAGIASIQKAGGSSIAVSGFTVGTKGEVTAAISNGTTGDMITLPVTISSTNYEDSVVRVVVTLQAKDTVDVTIKESSPVEKTYGDSDFSLSASVDPKTEKGTWTWFSSNEKVATVTDKGVVTIKGAGDTQITAIYESDNVYGEKSILLKIARKNVTITGVTVEGSKVYDGKKTCKIVNAGIVNGAVAGDDVSVVAGTAEYDNKNAGPHAVSFKGFSLTGEKAGNYILSSQPASLSATIAPREVPASVTPAGRTYEKGNIEVAINEGTISDVIMGDDVLLDISGGVGTMEDANAGKDKPVTITGLTLSGADAGNYRLIPPERGVVTISPAVWKGSSSTEVTKTYRYTDDSSETYDMKALLPDDCGSVTYEAPTISGGVAYDKAPSIEDGKLTYVLKKSGTDAEGTITVKVITQNYDTAFTLKVNIKLRSVALYEKAAGGYVICNTKELTEGMSFTLVPMFVDGSVVNRRVVWVSTNPAIASVTQDGKVTARAAGSTTIRIISEEDPGSITGCDVIVAQQTASVTLDKGKVSLGTGESVMINARVLPFDACQEVIWSVSDTSVAILWDEAKGIEPDGIVNGKGKVYDIKGARSVTVKAVGTGKAKVTVSATDGSGKKAVCSLDVGKPVPDFTVAGKENKTELKAGNTLEFKVNWGDKKLTPKNTGIIWSVTGVNNEDVSHIACISAKGILTGITQGYVRVMAVSVANPARKAYVDVRVTAPDKAKGAQVTGIEFTNKTALGSNVLKSGKSYPVNVRLTLLGKGSAAGNAVAWYSSDESVAAVTQKGVIKAVAPGTAVITAVIRDTLNVSTATIRDSVTVTVCSDIKSVKADKNKLTLGTEEGSVYGRVSIVEVNPVNATNTAIEWKSNNGNVMLAALPSGYDPSDDTVKDRYMDATGSGLTGTKKAKGNGVTVDKDQYLAVMAMKPGVTNLTGITMDGSNKKITCKVTVRGEVTLLKLKESEGKKGVNNVTLSDNVLQPGETVYTGNMKAGSNMTLTPLVDINNISASSTDKAEKAAYKAYRKYTDTSVSYRSSDTSVLTVDNKGKISVKKEAAGKSAAVYVVSADGRYKAMITITVL